MRNNFFAILLCLVLVSVAYRGSAQYYIGGYIRPDRLETGQIGAEILNKHTDLMILGFHPKANGYLLRTDHQATFTSGINYEGSFQGRAGVMSFSGVSNALMNGQQDLLVNNKTFTFASWVYINGQSTYVPGKFLFKKQENGKEISLRIGGNYGQLIFRVVENGITYSATANAPVTGILSNQWNHIAITFNGIGTAGSQIKLYVNGVAKVMDSSVAFPTTLPIINGNFNIGENFSGYLDEILVNDLALGQSDITNFYNGTYNFTSFNITKTVALWNFDDTNNVGKDLRSHKNIISRIKSMRNSPNIKIHLTISGGEWQTAISTATGRTNFANDINNIIIDQQLDGVDVDLEWPTQNTAAAFANYSAFVLKLREVIGNSKTLSLSLHPGYYKASLPAIDASDHVAIQMYGPSTTWWSYTKYVEAAQAALAYGIPKSKLIMGLPFFATTGVAGEQIGYRDIVSANPNLNFGVDQIMFNGKNYTFNGVNTIIQKSQYVCQNQLGGIMAWDIPLDMLDYNSSHSLVRAAIDALNSCATSSNVTLFGAKRVNDDITVDWQLNQSKEINYCVIEYSNDSTNFYQLDSIAIQAGLKDSVKTFSMKMKLVSLVKSVEKASLSIIGGIVFLIFAIQLTSSKKLRSLIAIFAVTLTIVSCQREEFVAEESSSEKNQYIRVKAVDHQGKTSYSDIVKIAH
ncbi:glycosyl hydrolase family 18 protein [Sphingobacterium bovistauri]|uniref:chitinase n=1 Tax=Sphingobacterium bovistauri TaxID=2781959 RepID=A0ABS7Z4Y6_9SPHI|nr:glycosyl hydrolase family 18 protein [Sphingobacterium bovistauri]MCA5004029.1 hypothetical protein [Sphingobacterium bovistauri]